MDMMDVPHLADKNKAKQKQYICNCLYGEDLSNVFFHTSSFLAHYSLRFLFFPDRRGKRWGFLLLYPICLKIQHGEMLFRSSWWLFKFEPGTIAMPWLKSLRWLRFLPCSGEYKNMNVNWNSWRVSAWLYALCRCHVICHMNIQVYGTDVLTRAWNVRVESLVVSERSWR